MLRLVADEPKGDTLYRFVYSDQRNLVRLLREALACSSASRSPGSSISRLQVGRSDLVRSRKHALWAPAPSKPLETTGERGANGAPPVRRVAPRTDLSNARS
jgi:hypothetical protein